MANDNNASYVLIGFTVIVGIVAIIATLVVLGGLRGEEDLVYAETYYEKPVSGLSVGSAVNFRGVKLGEVKDIGLVGNRYMVFGPDNERVYVLIAIPRSRLRFGEDEGVQPEKLIETLVERHHLRATVTASGVTGLSRIELDFNHASEPARKISWKPKTTYVPSAHSLLDNFSDAATKVMNQINKVDIETTWSNLNASVHAMTKTAEGAQALLEARQADVEKLVGDMAETTDNLRTFSQIIRSNPSLLIRSYQPDPLPETERK